MEPNKLNQGDFVSVAFASSEAEPQQRLSNYRQVSSATMPGEKGQLHDQATAAPSSHWNPYSDDRVQHAGVPVSCVEGGCAHTPEFQKNFSEANCHCRRIRDRRRLVFRFFALLLATGFFFWHFPSKYSFSGFRDTAAQAHFPLDVRVGELRKPSCSDLETFAETYHFGELKTFTLRNLIETSKHNIHFRNSFIHILPSEDQNEDIVVDFSFKSPDLEVQKSLDIKQTDDSLIIEFPSLELSTQPGIRIDVETQTKIYVRSGLKLENFEIESRILAISIPSAIEFWTDHTKLVCAAGSLEAHPFFNSRHTIIRERSGRVSGSFPLYDILDVSTLSGSISIAVLPRPADESDVQPAKLIATTNSGSMDIKYQDDEEIPKRHYFVSANSQSGTISGRIIHGTSTELQTTGGSITVTLLPYAANDYESQLTTITQSGTQRITVLPPLVHATEPLARLKGTHQALSGAVEVHYPSSWEGTVRASAMSGSISVVGHGLDIIRENNGLVGKYVEAKKGNGEGNTLCKTLSGSVRFTVG